MSQKIAILILIVLVAVLTSCTNTAFDSKKWKNWNGKESFVRWDMTDDLINNYNLQGKTHKEIENLLGKPSNGIASSPDDYYYDLGPCRRGIDYGSFYIEFKNDKVIQVEKHCH